MPLLAYGSLPVSDNAPLDSTSCSCTGTHTSSSMGSAVFLITGLTSTRSTRSEPPQAERLDGSESADPPVSGRGGGVGQRRLKPSGSWTAAKKRTWPVCPWPRPVGLRGARGQLMVLGVVGMVSTTPALVPTHSSSSHTSSAVIRRQAALCCRIMASEPVGEKRHHCACRLALPRPPLGRE